MSKIMYSPLNYVRILISDLDWIGLDWNIFHIDKIVKKSCIIYRYIIKCII